MSSTKQILIKVGVSLTTLALILSSFFLYTNSLFDASVDTIVPRIQNYGEERGSTDRAGWKFFEWASIFSLESGPLVFFFAN